MPRLRNKATGVIVTVGDGLAGRLGSEWEPADQAKKAEPKEKAPAPRRRSTKKTSDD